MNREIFIYPPIATAAKFDDLISRLAWYMHPYLNQISAIRISIPNHDWLAHAQLGPHLDASIKSMIPALCKKITIESDESLVDLISKANSKTDVLMLADASNIETLPEIIVLAINNFRKNAGFYNVDAQLTRQEGSFYLWAGLNKFTNPAELALKYRERFADLSSEIGQHQKAYIFDTGPSFSEFVENHDFSDGICIVANSIVKNKTALKILKPRIICAADPIYHAGCSTYAAEFRTMLVEALEQTKAWFVCPLRDAEIYRSFLPSHLEKKLVGIPFNSKLTEPTDLNTDFHLYPHPNVLTLALLPLASTFATCINIVGCDGRKLTDDSFFWSHDKKVQLNDQMNEIQAAHPGFFAIDYNDYYLDHCRDLENVLNNIEASGRQIKTETESLIPALQHRKMQDEILAPKSNHLLIIDPDAKDAWGHFLAYDKRVAEAASALGLRFDVISRLDLRPEFKPEHATNLIDVFSINSWTVGNKSPALRKHIIQFASELDQAISRIDTTSNNVCIFFYVGSFEAAEIIEFLLCEHKGVRAVINLFWSYNFDQNDVAYRKRWHPIAKRLSKHPRIHLMHSTPQIAAEFTHDWGISLPVLEHPSTTFSDVEAKHLINREIPSLSTSLDRTFRVVFPGGARAEKGFVLGIQSAEILRDHPRIEVAFRSRVDNVSGPALRRAYEALDKSNIRILDEDMSDEQFIEMISDSDIVVIPYHAAAFRRRTSGILVDSMLLGKPVVVLDDTWLADIINETGIGVATPATAEDIALGVEKIILAYPEYVKRIEVARSGYIDHNSWAKLVGSIVSLSAVGGNVVNQVDGYDYIFDPSANSELIKYTSDLMLGKRPPSPDRPISISKAMAALPSEDAIKRHVLMVEAFMSHPHLHALQSAEV